MTIDRPRAGSNWLLILLLALCITRFWLMPLPSSFWTDEAGTAFVVQRPADPSLAAVPQVPASIYYALPRVVASLFRFSEVSYRFPSVLLMGIALFVTGRLAARLIHPDAAWFAAFACLGLADLNYHAAEARPYALGICVAAVSLYFLVDWLDTARVQAALLFVIFAAILWRVHLVFWAFYPIFPIYAIVRLARATTRVTWTLAFVVFSLPALTLIPVALQALDTLRNAKAHAFAPVPDFRSLSIAVPWKPLALCAGLAWLCSRVFRWRVQKTAPLSTMALVAAWWLWMPLCLFGFSRLTGTVLFLPRYFSPALPGAALAATAAAAFFIPGSHWKRAAVAMAALALITVGHWRALWPDHSRESWRQASLDEALAARQPDTPVVAVSPFIEALSPVWSPEYRLPGFLYAPLFVYPLRGKVYPFPFAPSRDVEKYALKLFDDTLSKRPRFIVYGVSRNTEVWVQWFSRRSELAGWRYTPRNEKAIQIAVFENLAPRSPP